MYLLDFIEKFSALASGALSSWPSITTNAITVLLFGLTLYGFIYRSVSGLFKIVQLYWDARNKKIEDSRRIEALKKSILHLSKSEIAILKFVLKQHLHVAWLPNEDTSVFLLERKNIIRNVDLTKTKIVGTWRGSNYGISCNLYQLTDKARMLLTEKHKELYKNWRKIKTKCSFSDFQS